MSVEFDPVPIGRQRRRIDPVVLVVVAILAGFLVIGGAVNALSDILRERAARRRRLAA